LLIISAFASVYVASVVGIGNAVFGVPAIWVGFLAGIAASTLLSVVFGVVCIEFKADQIIAGLAVWLIALGLAPFMSTVFFGGVNTPNLGARVSWRYSAVMVVVATLASWWALNRTAFGKHLRAAGENPKALDTVGVSVSRVRYAGVLVSGVLSGVGGSALALSIGQFVGSGETMVQGKGSSPSWRTCSATTIRSARSAPASCSPGSTRPRYGSNSSATRCRTRWFRRFRTSS
jgi:nucleoside ABC transporter membrane protein